LRGEILQVPSSVSAIKISGERSYARVRAGRDVELAARPVRVSRFCVLASRVDEVAGVPVLDVDVQVECTAGTYIRALARDLGAALGVGGHLTALRRTRVGAFQIDEAQTLDRAEKRVIVLPLDGIVQRCFATLPVTDTQAAHIRYGRRLAGLTLPKTPTALITQKGSFLALYRQQGPDAVADAVLV
jgi:tRNA pseudouridine55 synthase